MSFVSYCQQVDGENIALGMEAVRARRVKLPVVEWPLWDTESAPNINRKESSACNIFT